MLKAFWGFGSIEIARNTLIKTKPKNIRYAGHYSIFHLPYKNDLPINPG